jgi:intraflagellar transport protein 172
LLLYNIKEQKKQTLLNYCKYISWVPNSDVVVAQVTMYQIKGDVVAIERAEGKTEVIVDDGTN